MRQVRPEPIALRFGSLRDAWRRLQPFVGISPRWLAAVAATSIVAGVAEAGVLAIVVQIASTMSRGRGVGGIDIGPFALSHLSVVRMLLLALALTTVRLALQLLGAYLPARLNADVQARLRDRVATAWLRAPWSLQATEREGHFQDLVTNQTTRSTMLLTTFAGGVAGLCSFVTLALSAVIVNPTAAAVILTVIIALFFVLRPLSSIAKKLSRQQVTAMRRYASEVASIVALAEETHVFGVRDARLEQLAALNDRVRRPYFRAQLVRSSVPALYQGLTMLLVVSGLGVLWAIGGTRLVSLGAVVLILLRALSYSQSLQSTYHSVQELLPFADLVADALDRYERAAETLGSRLVSGIGTIAFDRVSFGYAPDRPVLRELTFSVDGGEAVAIAGPSGAGKSTLVQLLLGVRRPDDGRVLVDGVDLAELDADAWAQRVGYVPQDTKLLSGTVSENIRFFRPHIDDDAVRAAAVAAHIHDEIVTWRDGYDTVVGQRADAVSGGQRQRLCLARALAGGPSVLVLDEPTSALDARSERLVRESLQALKGDITVFVVAHRLSLIDVCDRVLEVDGGRLRERRADINEAG